MKILEIINEISSRGGAEVFAVNLSNELAKDPENEVVFVTLYANEDKSLVSSLASNIKDLSCNKTKHIDFSAAKRLKRIINEFQPDIVHTHLSCLPTYYLAFGSKKRKWKIFHTVHNIAEKDTNRFGDFVKKKLIKKNNLTLVGISSKVTDSINNYYQITNTPTIFNGVKLQNPKSVSQKDYDFICVARFFPQKNHKLLIDAFAKYLEAHPKSTLLLVGKGETEKEIKQLVKSKNLESNIKFYGYTNDVYPLLLTSRCFVLSSLYEGNPISILEAMDCGLPIIAPNVGGIPDVVKDKTNGLLFEVNNSSDLLRCMNDIFSLNSSAFVSKNNIADIKKYSIEKTAKQYLELFVKD